MILKRCQRWLKRLWIGKLMFKPNEWHPQGRHAFRCMSQLIQPVQPLHLSSQKFAMTGVDARAGEDAVEDDGSPKSIKVSALNKHNHIMRTDG